MPVNCGPSATFDDQRHAALLGDRLVELGDIAHGAADIEALGVAFEGAGLQARDQQQALNVLISSSAFSMVCSRPSR